MATYSVEKGTPGLCRPRGGSVWQPWVASRGRRFQKRTPTEDGCGGILDRPRVAERERLAHESAAPPNDPQLAA